MTHALGVDGSIVVQQMDKVELYEFGGMTHRSNAMFERRQRILNEARKMIARNGIDDFNIRELCRRAGVAQGTLYYAFGSKENVMALAIRSHFDTLANFVVESKDPSQFLNALERQFIIVLRNLEIPNFLRAISTLYFSPSLHARVREVLVEIGGRTYASWIRLLVMQRQLEEGVVPARLLEDISNLQYAKVHERGLGLLDDDSYVEFSIKGVLVMLIGATRGAARKEVKDAFDDFSAKGPLTTRLFTEARLAIAGLASERSFLASDAIV